jgi:multidrug transporter EmrE-like cation transporter
MNYIYVFLTILLTVYGQIIIKWQVSKAGILPLTMVGKLEYMFHLLLNGWIIGALFAAFLASLTWMAAMTKLPLSYVYPFMSLSFVLVTILSVIFFNEAMTIPKILGLSLIIIGLIVSSSL